MLDLEELALHESGHAVAADRLGFEFRSIELRGEESGDYFNKIIGIVGETHSSASDLSAEHPDKSRKRNAAVVAMSGRPARRLKYPDSDAQWEQLGLELDDRRRALALLAGDEIALREVAEEAQELVEAHRAAIEALARQLLDGEVPVRLTAEDARPSLAIGQ